VATHPARSFKLSLTNGRSELASSGGAREAARESIQQFALGQGILRAPWSGSGGGTSVKLAWMPNLGLFYRGGGGEFESVRSGFADYARNGETERDLRARVHSTVLADVERQVMALRALRAKPRDMDAGESFGDVVARSRPVEPR